MRAGAPAAMRASCSMRVRSVVSGSDIAVSGAESSRVMRTDRPAASSRPRTRWARSSVTHVLPQAGARGADVGVTVPGVERNVDRLRAGEQEQEPEQKHRASVAAAFGCSKVRESATM